MASRDTRDVALRVPSTTLLKLLACALLVWALLQILPLLVLVLLAFFVAVALDPLVCRLETWRLPRGVATGLVGLVLLAVIGFTFAVIMPAIAAELSTIAADLPRLEAEVHDSLRRYPLVDRAATEVFGIRSNPAFTEWFGDFWTVGSAAISLVMGFAIVIVLALYFLLEGKRLYVWLLAYVPRTHRERMAQTIPQVSDVMRAYIQGQLITSAIAGVLTGALLFWFDVPAVLPLAVLAALCDVIPFLGILVIMFVASALSLTVSPWAAVVVALALAAYHVFEAYVVIPAVYGKKLELSTLAVILALLVGGVLGGILGAVLVLPFVAAYPIIERIWLHEYLSPEVLEDHGALEDAAKSGSDEEVEQAIEAVQKGETPPAVH